MKNYLRLRRKMPTPTLPVSTSTAKTMTPSASTAVSAFEKIMTSAVVKARRMAMTSRNRIWMIVAKLRSWIVPGVSPLDDKLLPEQEFVLTE